MKTLASIYSRQMLTGEYTICIEAYYLKDWLDLDMPLHSHNRMEIMYVISGKCAVELADIKLTLHQGQMVLLDANVLHGLRVAEKSECRIMNIEFILSEGSGLLPLRRVAENYRYLQQFLAERRPAIMIDDSADLFSIITRLIYCLDTSDKYQRVEIEILSCELLMNLAKQYSETHQNNLPVQLHVRRAILYLQKNYSKEVTISDISGYLQISSAHLSRIFKKDTGKSISAYLTSIRLEKAKMLLEKSDLPVVDISGCIGIPSRIYFTQLFKKHVGITPGEFRMNYRRKQSVMHAGCP